MTGTLGPSGRAAPGPVVSRAELRTARDITELIERIRGWDASAFGRPEPGELAIPAVVRHAYRSAGLTLPEADVRLATVVYWHDVRGVSRIGLFFAAEHDPSIMGEPRISWPPERSTLKWSSRGTLRPGTDPVCVAGVGLARRGICCAVLGPDGQITCETGARPQPYASHSI